MRAIIAVALLLLGAAPLAAQSPTYRIRLSEPWSLRLGQTLRVSVADRGTDSLPLVDPNGGTVQVPRIYVVAIDSLLGFTPRGQRVRQGAMDGLISGLVIGALFGALTHENSGRTTGANAGVFAAVGGVGGALFGAGIGAVRSGERWQTVWPPEHLRPRR